MKDEVDLPGPQGGRASAVIKVKVEEGVDL